MRQELEYRVILLVLFITAFMMSEHFRGRADKQRGKMSRRGDGAGFLVPQAIITLATLGWLLTYLIAPQWIAWSQVELPPWLRFVGAGLGVTAIGLWFAVLSTGEAVARIDVLDVGQGHAVLIRDGGSSILIDVGPPDGAATRALARVDAGRSLDAILLTHADRDHTGGLREIERRFDVGEVLAGAPTEGMVTRRIDIGDRIWISPRTSVEVLSPPVVTLGAEHASENDRSLVLMVTIGDRRILLAADIEAAAERWLIRSGISLAADVLLVPHHGSLTSSTPEFVQAVSPRVAVISVGDRNSYGHPRPEVLARYEGVLVIRTDLSGDITLRSDGERLWLASGR